MKTWRSTRLLSLILVLAMLIQMLPPQAFALSSSEDSVIATATEAESQPVVTVLGEVEELREEDTKHFRLSDGSFVAVSYGLPVHYEDEDGQWQDIAVGRGFARAADNEVILIVDTAERPEDIDENRARAAAERARERLQVQQSRREYYSGQFAMTRAMTRLKVKERKYS